ncbi:MAG: zinc ABC transporter substrate-binding protein [Crocinitomicaceae bacterium]|nr:zinc ABC transporter substrate-binding protein [Crocinitomicaceae bacterium]
MRGFIVALIGLTLMGCRIEEEKEITRRKGPLHIVTTTGIIEDCLTHIVGDSMEVTALMGPGTDPHIYKPTPGDVELMDEADIIVANGLHLEGKMAEMLQKYGKEKPVLFVSDGIDSKDIIKSADFQDARDPHIWFDTDIWMQGMDYIAKELGKIDTISASYYQINANLYREKVRDMDNWVKEQFESLEIEKPILITSHDAFSYFGRRYGIEVKGIQGISTLSEVGLKEISEMVDFVIEHRVKSIFVETSTSQKTAQSIIDGCRDKNYTVNLAGPLFSDALGEPDTDAGTYMGMIKENVKRIVEGLK